MTPDTKKKESFTHYYLPVNIERIINNLKINKNISNRRDKCELCPIQVIIDVQKLVAQIKNILKINENEGLNLFISHILVSLASKEICIRHRLRSFDFKELLEEIKNKVEKSLAHPGEAVGAIAA